MRRELIDRCLTLINTKYIAKNKELPIAGMEMWEALLAGMDDEIGCKAVGSVLLDLKYVPDWADVREAYANLIGAATDETTDEAVARKRREAEATEAIRIERERYQEECNRRYGRIMADPVLRREWFRSHSCEAMPFAEVIDSERRGTSE
jgi:hypothetical protein